MRTSTNPIGGRYDARSFTEAPSPTPRLEKVPSTVSPPRVIKQPTPVPTSRREIPHVPPQIRIPSREPDRVFAHPFPRLRVVPAVPVVREGGGGVRVAEVVEELPGEGEVAVD